MQVQDTEHGMVGHLRVYLSFSCLSGKSLFFGVGGGGLYALLVILPKRKEEWRDMYAEYLSGVSRALIFWMMKLLQSVCYIRYLPIKTLQRSDSSFSSHTPHIII